MNESDDINSTKVEPMTQLFTCISCQVAFKTAVDQRQHMRSDWHRYNLKRKVAELPPVTAATFAQKLELVHKTQEVEAVKDNECITCRKSYNCEQQYTNHLSSKKHKELLAKYPNAQKKESSTIKPVQRNWNKDFMNATSEQEIHNIIQEKRAESLILSELDCLFCPSSFKDTEGNIKHMTANHSFFIPDIEFLVDLQGLLKYLGEKISTANVCIYCNGKGKGFNSIEAVRDHMVSKGHCKIIYEDGADMEIVDFYDFSDTWEDLSCESDSNAMEGDVVEFVPESSRMRKPEITEDELEMILPSGHRIGHRSLKTYYKQSIRPFVERDSSVIKAIQGRYKELGYYGSSTSAIAIAERAKRVAIHHKHTMAKKFYYQQQDLKFRIGMKHNALNSKHYRSQVMMF